MKKNLLLAAALLTVFFATAQEGYTEVSVNMLPAYANQVYYKFATNTQTPVAAASWDIAFQKSPAQIGMGSTIINDGNGLKVYQVATSEAGYATVDVTQQTGWIELHNSHLTWNEGAFDNAQNPTPGPFNYGWGNYEMNNNHRVKGLIVFVLKYADNSYKKLFLDVYDPYTGNITFKYATWDGNAWSADVNQVVDTNASATHNFAYFSFQTNNEVTVAPADADWDMVFRKYTAPVTSGGQTVMYPVTGALQSPLVTVAQIAETGNTDAAPVLPATTAYSAEINTIGDDWKAFGGTGYVINPTNTYYVKHQDGNIYRMYFTSFSGTAAGTLSFNYKNVSSTAGMEDFNKTSFGFYPNPTADRNITFIYDLQNSAEKNTVKIYSLTGAKVFETELANNGGFSTQEVQLSNLTSGVYVVTLESGKQTVTKKLVIQ